MCGSAKLSTMYQRTLPLSLLALAACVSSSSAGPDLEPASRCGDEVVAGISLPEGTRIVACNLAPDARLVAVDDGYVYTHAGSLIRDAIGGGEQLRLIPLADLNESSVSIYDGRVFFSFFTSGNGGIYSGPFDRLTAYADITAVTDAFAPTRPSGWSLSDGRFRYSSSTNFTAEGANSGGVVEVDHATGALRRISSEYGTPVGLSAEHIYYCHGNELRRVSRSGGASALVTSERPVSHCSAETNRAVDENFIYFTLDSAPFEIWRFGVDGYRELVHTEPHDLGDFPSIPPSFVRYDDGWLYFGGPGALSRLRPEDAEATVEVVAYGHEGGGLGTPMFWQSWIFVTDHRGGYDTPLETVVLAIEK